MKLYRERPVLTSQIDVSKLQKQLGIVIKIHFDQSAIFGPLSLGLVCTVHKIVSLRA